MNEHVPYEDELKKRLDDLPLPNENIAWEDMKRRLDKDDDDRPIIPPVSVAALPAAICNFSPAEDSSSTASIP